MLKLHLNEKTYLAKKYLVYKTLVVITPLGSGAADQHLARLRHSRSLLIMA